MQQLIGKNPTDFKKQKKGVEARRKAFANSAAQDSAAAEAVGTEGQKATSGLERQLSRPASADIPSEQVRDVCSKPADNRGPSKRQKLDCKSPQPGHVQCPVCKRYVEEAVDINSHVGEHLQLLT